MPAASSDRALIVEVGARYVTDFYDRLDKARRAEASLRHVDTDAFDAYYQRREKELSEVRGANATARQIAALRRLNEDILKSRDFPGDEKLQMVNENGALIRGLAKQFVVETGR